MATKKEITTDELKSMDMSKRVTIRSIAPWNTGFPNRLSSTDTRVQPLGRATVRREELVEHNICHSILETEDEACDDKECHIEIKHEHHHHHH